MNPSSVAEKRALAEVLTKATPDPAVGARSPPSIKLAAQNCYSQPTGAFTGEISALQLTDSKIPFVILGHSERRTLFGETSAVVAAKTKAAVEAGLVILCVGRGVVSR
ncbi:triosephosphate isomerase [Mycena olivaceomarginata]|nr:triosephosphate isomerase [Mycena olivaceomarginata]